MVIDLVELRRHGAKLPRGEVLAAKPMRGRLQLSAGRPGWWSGQKDAPLLAGVVALDGVSWLRPPLDHARVVRIDRDALLIVGVQEEGGRQRDVRSYRQAWWCRLVAPGSGERQAQQPQDGELRGERRVEQPAHAR